MSDDIRYWIGLSLLPGIGPARLGRLIQRFQSAEQAWRASPDELQRCGIDEKLLPALLEKRRILDLAAELERVEQIGARVLTWKDPEYPTLLRETFNHPPVLYVHGEIRREDKHAIAVVGTRRPSLYGQALTLKLVPTLVEQGLTIVSGLARGIDSLAHRAALEAGGRTIAVLGSGLDVMYPAENRRLAQEIAQHGAVLSEYALGTQPDAFNFPARNRIISGLSLGTVVVQAGEKSGALITAAYALEQNREVFAFPGRVTDRESAGCNQLIKHGQAKLIMRPDDILEELNRTVTLQQLEIKSVIPENTIESQLLSLLSSEPVHVDDLGRQTALPIAEVTSALTMLELKGIIRQVGSMHYVRVR
jgi:DNA processing protein